MQFETRALNDVPVAVELLARERLGNALDHWSHRVDRVRVTMSDLNGPRGGVDKRCRVVVIGRRSWMVVVEAEAPTWQDAVDRSAGKAARAVRRELERLRPARRPLSDRARTHAWNGRSSGRGAAWGPTEHAAGPHVPVKPSRPAMTSRA